ncbi:MAG TPA: MarR family transcriptional regulator [Actinomycetes bacterium]|jgi:DNA-binding MarR family transcriptional regulator|nr:MarR family transcriptional regulator [Actinomycetes bacterium]
MGLAAQHSADAVRAWPEDLLQRSNFLLCKLSNVAKRALVEELAAEELPLPHHRLPHLAVLTCLADSGPTCQKDIAERLRVDGSDMVAVLDDLEHAGYVTRARDPSDRRRHAVSITSSGRRALGRLDQRAAHADDTLLGPLTTTERELLHRLLRRVLTHHDTRMPPQRP